MQVVVCCVCCIFSINCWLLLLGCLKIIQQWENEFTPFFLTMCTRCPYLHVTKLGICQFDTLMRCHLRGQTHVVPGSLSVRCGFGVHRSTQKYEILWGGVHLGSNSDECRGGWDHTGGCVLVIWPFFRSLWTLVVCSADQCRWRGVAVLQRPQLVPDAAGADAVGARPTRCRESADVPHQPRAAAGTVHRGQECIHGDQVPLAATARRHRQGRHALRLRSRGNSAYSYKCHGACFVRIINSFWHQH